MCCKIIRRKVFLIEIFLFYSSYFFFLLPIIFFSFLFFFQFYFLLSFLSCLLFQFFFFKFFLLFIFFQFLLFFLFFLYFLRVGQQTLKKSQYQIVYIAKGLMSIKEQNLSKKIVSVDDFRPILNEIN